MRDGRGRQGFALLIVLWTLGLLALLIGHLTASARTQLALAETARNEAEAEAAADGAVQHAIFALRAGSSGITGVPQGMVIGRVVVALAMQDRSMMINPNYAPSSLLAALLRQGGMDAASAQRLGRSIMEWHTGSISTLDGRSNDAGYRAAGLPYAPTHRFFSNDEELGLVLGMTPRAMDLLRPWLSVYQAGDPSLAADFGTTRSLVQQAQASGPNGVLGGFNSQYRIVRITATAAVGGVRFTRSALVRLPLHPTGDTAPVLIIRWE
jgi:general secretion pathway protein K